MSETKTTLTWLLRDEVSATAGKIDKKLKGLGDTGKGVGGALSGLVNPSMLAAAGIGALGGVLLESIHGAIEAEKGIARLDAALKANVPNWQDSTKAITDAEQASASLGFTDDEVRNSLTKLVPATKNVAKAVDTMRVAQDLARFKGISLSDATDALTKVEAGQYRGLKSLGIVLKDGATATDALAAVEKVASGQAAAFADTIDGKLSIAQAKWNNALDRAGEKLLPLVATGMDLLSNALDTLAPATSQEAQALDTLAAHGMKFTDSVTQSLPAMADYVHDMDKLEAATIDARDAVKSYSGWLDKTNVRYETYSAWLHSTSPTFGDQTPKGRVKARAEGGWVGLNGPEMVLTGERGPEYVIPHNKLGGGAGGFTIQGVSERELVDMVDRGLYFRMKRAGTGR